MSSLYVFHQSSPEQPYKVLTHAEDIVSTLAEHGVAIERWQPTGSVTPGASQEDVISACQPRLDALMTERGYAAVEVISLAESHPQKAELRAGLREEHYHASDELRVFAGGRGVVMLHIGEYVYAVLCEKYDVLSIPAGTRQWFDMGENPRLVTLRLFKQQNGVVAHFTGETIVSQFPELDDF